MILKNPIDQVTVYNHWRQVEGSEKFSYRGDIINPLCEMKDLQWHEAELENTDLTNLYNISSDDWKDAGICTPDFKVSTSAKNIIPTGNEIHLDINKKIEILKTGVPIFDTKLFIVADSIDGPFTIIEGNKRAVALCLLNLIQNLKVFLGISSSMSGYVWSRHSYED